MAWAARGSYYEACNCDAVCPCRRHGDRTGGRSTYGTCDFVLSWAITCGHVDDRDLAGLSVVLVGSYVDEEPHSPWRVAMFVDDRADEIQQADLADVFLGRLGGDTARLYGLGIVDVSLIRPASINLTHEVGSWRIGVASFVEVRSTVEADVGGPVSCGITDHSEGTELIADVQVVAVPPFEWKLRGRCAFASAFAYRSAGGPNEPSDAT